MIPKELKSAKRSAIFNEKLDVGYNSELNMVNVDIKILEVVKDENKHSYVLCAILC